MRSVLLLANVLCISADVYGIAYWNEARWMGLLAANVIALAVVWMVPKDA